MSSIIVSRAAPPFIGVTQPVPPASNFFVHSNATSRELAYFFLRLTLGINILMHGLSRILSGLSPFAAGMIKQFASTPLPPSMVHAFAYVLPWSELFIGIAILLGLWTWLALVLGALEIVVLTFGIALTQNWTVAAIQMTYAVVYAILLAFGEYNRWSLDRWRNPRPNYRDTVE